MAEKWIGGVTGQPASDSLKYSHHRYTSRFTCYMDDCVSTASLSLFAQSVPEPLIFREVTVHYRAGSATLTFSPLNCAVQHGFVYRECDSEGRWISMKNASECQLDDSEQVTPTAGRACRCLCLQRAFAFHLDVRWHVCAQWWELCSTWPCVRGYRYVSGPFVSTSHYVYLYVWVCKYNAAKNVPILW